jgi:hypothetical protein
LYIHIQDESENKVLDELCGKHLSTWKVTDLQWINVKNWFDETASLRNQMQEAGLMVNEKRPFKVSIPNRLWWNIGSAVC